MDKRLIGFTLFFILISGCVSPNQSDTTVKIGFIPSAFYLPLYVAMEKGYFTEEGLTPQYTQFTSVSDQLNALVKGDIDLTGVGSSGGFALESRSPGSILFVYGQDLQSYSYLVKKNSPITSLSQLEGKTIGTWSSPTATLFIHLTLGKFFDPTNAQIQQMDFKLLNDALEVGQIDAAFSADVFTQTGIDKGISQYLEKNPVTTHIHDPFFNGGGIISTQMAHSNPEKSGKIVRALTKAIIFVQQNPEEARKTMKSYLPFDDQILLEAPIDHFYPVTSVNPEEVQVVADLLYENNVITTRLVTNTLFWNNE